MQNVILEKVICLDGRTTGSLYYYEGNFYFPINMHGGQVGRVKKAARNFVKENKELVKRDRSDKNYKTVLEIFDEFYGDLKK